MSLFLVVYVITVVILTVYGINCHIMVSLFKRHFKERTADDQRIVATFYKEHREDDLPIVTSQIPIYNEMNVAERVIDAVAAITYPQGKHEIQVLDDSTDETSRIVAQKVAQLQAAGVWITHIQRSNREGYKAGALKFGLQQAHGEFLAIFDADFVPSVDFLLTAVPFLVEDPQLGLVQGRWGHLNNQESLITQFQAIGIDGHFAVEQTGRNWNDLFMNFNGTGGIFRRKAVLDVGNWNTDTLTEDLDLSYRMQLGGWGCRYLMNLVVPAEIPTDIGAFKSQQFRWAKGSMQTAMKLLPAVWRSPARFFKKFQATIHLTHYVVHPLMAYVAVIAPLLLIYHQVRGFTTLFLFLTPYLLLSFMGPSRMYWTSQKYLYGLRSRQTLFLPFLMCFGCGMAINNTKAILEAFIGKQSEFIRTPKKGNAPKKRYKSTLNLTFLVELLLGVWCMIGLYFYLTTRQYIVGYFLLMYGIGFLYIGSLSFIHQMRNSM